MNARLLLSGAAFAALLAGTANAQIIGGHAADAVTGTLNGAVSTITAAAVAVDGVTDRANADEAGNAFTNTAATTQDVENGTVTGAMGVTNGTATGATQTTGSTNATAVATHGPTALNGNVGGSANLTGSIGAGTRPSVTPR